jgi:UDPglucose--hexose-1-phosphate uridylyltransferase
MPQFRQDFITKEWVIVAPERAKRPDQFRSAEERRSLPAHDPACPFCPGNEAQTPAPLYTRDNASGWRIRVVPNKFAAVNPDLVPRRSFEGRYLSTEGFGIAEVVIETPAHDGDLALASRASIAELLIAYKSRYADLAVNPKVDLITIFRNHGARAGTSLEHPHSQIIATPIVPPHVRNVMQQALLYHDTFGECPYCDVLKEELAQRTRVVLEGRHFVVYCPYASRSPLETRIVPKKHCSRFDNLDDGEETEELAELLRMTLKKLRVGLNDPDYNLIIHSSPNSDGELHYDHWRFIIVPRITTAAGFELGSGISINIMPPEEAAGFLREVKVE